MDIKQKNSAEIRLFAERSKAASEKSPISLFLIGGKYLTTVFTACTRTKTWLDAESENRQHIFTATRPVIAENVKAMVPNINA